MNWCHYLVFAVSLLQVDPRVVNIVGTERFIFMEDYLRNNNGLLIDARTLEWFNLGSIDVSFTLLSKLGTLEMDEAHVIFGGRPRENVSTVFLTSEQLGLLGDGKKAEKWDFSNARDLGPWCYGPECGQSPRTIKGLLKTGLSGRQGLRLPEWHAVVDTDDCSVGRIADFYMNMSVT
jgi:hypothetical protein